MATNLRKAAVMLAAFFVLPLYVSGQTTIEKETETRLEEIQTDEQAAMADLFTLEQEISQAEKEAADAAGRIETLSTEKSAIEERIVLAEATLVQHRERLGELLATYQKTGPGTFVEILLNAKDLTDFIRRLNILRDFSRRTGETMDTIDEVKADLEKEAIALAGQVAMLEEKQEELEKAIEDKSVLISEQEAYLISLKEERSRYETLLEDVAAAWQALKPVFSSASKGFTELAESGSLPPEAVRTTFSLKGIRAYITDDAFNKAVKDNRSLPDMVFDFGSGYIDLEIPARQLSLTGSFEAVDGHILSFRAEEGTFYGLPLTRTSIDALFEQGGLDLDIAPLLEGNKVLDATSDNGELVLSIGLSIF